LTNTHYNVSDLHAIMNQLVVLALCMLAVMATEIGYPSEYGHGRFAFHGRYGSKCGNDGFYYKDHASFVICSNGNAYEQACAPGSRNSAFDKYHSGGHYYYRDFCDVNLVDYGAGISHGYGYGHGGYAAGGYGHGGYGAGGYGHGGYGAGGNGGYGNRGAYGHHGY